LTTEHKGSEPKRVDHSLDFKIRKMQAKQLPHPADSIVSTTPLGALYSPTQTIFRVWAPTANRITLHLYEGPTGGSSRPMRMRKSRDGVWESILLGDWRGAYYTYTASGHDTRFDPSRELVDPYARAVTRFDGRGIVVHDETPIADRPVFSPSEAVIYEMHVRDFTIDPDSGVQRRGKYLGLIEARTSLSGRPDIETGLDHLSALGVNVVQLMPIGEFHTDDSNDLYGWGYDSVHFNTPAGWYATERFDARRVAEVKRMIDALHQRGIRVTLDVVYNHTFESITKHRVYSFEGLVPGYYYRLQSDGSYWNGSGTGNEFRSEAPMARRFLIDSVKHWATEYKVDGFRFDLMSLIDHETLMLMVRELRSLDPNLLLYGEPWAGGATPIDLAGKGAQRSAGYSVFNDNFRDAMKGQVFDARATGFVQSGFGVDVVKKGICGAVNDFADAPVESINYVECHDNHTLWDRLLISTVENAAVTAADRRAMDKLAAAVLFTSQGVPFMQAGQEFLRSKGGDHNSYDKPDSINMLRWRMKAENHDVYEYYRGLIRLRHAHPLFRFEKGADVRRAVKFLDEQLGLSSPLGCIGYQIEDVLEIDAWVRALVLLNTQPRQVEFLIPPGDWGIFVDSKQAGDREIKPSTSVVTETKVRVAARSAVVLGEMRKPGENRWISLSEKSVKSP
jgi:pullulanase